ncbi:MAG TPA: helix-turn-helix domain-containing protein [Candidatus Udaeobacter sp.]
MKPSKKPIKPQSGIRMPLNKILGAETYVRILRALYELNVPITLSELARRIKMDKSGVWRAISALHELGAVEAVGLGGQQAIQPRREYPLTGPLMDLFQAERQRFEKLREKLSDVAHSLVPPAKSVWIQGAVAMEHDAPNDPIAVGILAPSSDVGRLAEAFQRETATLQKQFNVTVEVKPLTTADLAVLDASELRSLETIILLAGVPPLATNRVHDFESARSRSGRHQHYDAQSLRIAHAISQWLGKDVTLIRRAQDYVNRRLATASPREAKELHEWHRILENYSVPQIRRLLNDTGERATRLRQSSPFTPILSASERAHVMQQMHHN